MNKDEDNRRIKARPESEESSTRAIMIIAGIFVASVLALFLVYMYSPKLDELVRLVLYRDNALSILLSGMKRNIFECLQTLMTQKNWEKFYPATKRNIIIKFYLDILYHIYCKYLLQLKYSKLITIDYLFFYKLID